MSFSRIIPRFLSYELREVSDQLLIGACRHQDLVTSFLTDISPLHLIELDSPSGISLKFSCCASSHFTFSDSRMFLLREMSLAFWIYGLINVFRNHILLILSCLKKAGYAADCDICLILMKEIVRLVGSRLRQLELVITTGRMWEIKEDSGFLEKPKNQPILTTDHTARWKGVLKRTLYSRKKRGGFWRGVNLLSKWRGRLGVYNAGVKAVCPLYSKYFLKLRLCIE